MEGYKPVSLGFWDLQGSRLTNDTIDLLPKDYQIIIDTCCSIAGRFLYRDTVVCLLVQTINRGFVITGISLREGDS